MEYISEIIDKLGTEFKLFLKKIRTYEIKFLYLYYN